MNLNRELRVVFQPKDKDKYEGKRRFGIGIQSLHEYIGKYNAKIALERLRDCQTDKCSVRFRTRGRVDFYFK